VTTQARGNCIVKFQDETEAEQQCSQVELIQLLKVFRFAVINQLVMVQSTIPITGKGSQSSARNNHSYALVAGSRR
jgi:hypothetical protein